MKTSNDQFPNESEKRIRFLMLHYYWSKLEAESYYYYDPYDESDWAEYE
jgi:hypothetical protein